MRRRLSRRAEGMRRRFVAYGDGKLGPRLSHPGHLTQSVRFAVNQPEPTVVHNSAILGVPASNALTASRQAQ
jgi:hypothetical protein